MTRFLISLPEAVETVIYAFKEMVGSEIFARQIPSINITELAKTIGPDCSLKEIGLRPGEKLHEQLISADESSFTYKFDKYYKILSPLTRWNECKKRVSGGKRVNEGFVYSSEKNSEWLSNGSLKKWIDASG